MRKLILLSLCLYILVSCKKEIIEDAVSECPMEQVISCRCANGETFNFDAGGYVDQCEKRGGVERWHCN